MKNPDFSILISILLPLSFIGAGCGGFQGLKRYAGPEYEAETKSWQRVLNERGGNGMWLVTRGYHLGDDVVAIATASALSHAAILDKDNRTSSSSSRVTSQLSSVGSPHPLHASKD